MNISGAKLQDEALLAEIRLVSELMVAAEASAQPLGQSEIDELLGLARDARPLG